MVISSSTMRDDEGSDKLRFLIILEFLFEEKREDEILFDFMSPFFELTLLLLSSFTNVLEKLFSRFIVIITVGNFCFGEEVVTGEEEGTEIENFR